MQVHPAEKGNTYSCFKPALNHPRKAVVTIQYMKKEPNNPHWGSGRTELSKGENLHAEMLPSQQPALTRGKGGLQLAPSLLVTEVNRFRLSSQGCYAVTRCSITASGHDRTIPMHTLTALVSWKLLFFSSASFRSPRYIILNAMLEAPGLPSLL